MRNSVSDQCRPLMIAPGAPTPFGSQGTAGQACMSSSLGPLIGRGSPFPFIQRTRRCTFEGKSSSLSLIIILISSI
jgi:hypothetical protein